MGFLNIPWWVWGILALIIAGIFVVFVPRREKVYQLQGITFIIVRWFHSLVWLLLAVSFFLRDAPSEAIGGLANPLATLGGLVYLIYMITLVKALS